MNEKDATSTSDLIDRARAFCAEAHDSQMRDDGRPYATHPEAVADLLRQAGLDAPEILAAAYLHDVIEDTGVRRDALAERFGETVTRLVEELTNIPPAGASFQEKHAALVEKARRMSDAAKLVKLADRLHNLSEMGAAWPAHKQARYRRATIDLLAALDPIPPEGAPLKARIEGLLQT